MKVVFRCYKCGETFAAEETVRSDVCPHCMSFVDLSRAERADGAAALQPGEGAPSPAEPPAPRPQPRSAPAGNTYEALYAEAEKMMSVGAWSNAAALFRRCLSGRDSWQARFGLVRAATRELTDLASFSEVQKDAAAAFGKMSPQERLALGRRYVPKLEEMRQSLARSCEAMEGYAPKEAAPMRVPGESARKKGRAAIACGVLLFALLVIMGSFMLSFSAAFGGAVMGFGALLCAACCVSGALANRKEKAAEAARRTADAEAERTRRAECAGLKRRMDAVDYLCGFLKY